MRALLLIAPSLVACSTENVAPLIEFGPISAFVSVELGPLSAESGRDVDPRIYVHFSHRNPDCPVFDRDINASIDGVRPDSFERGYYDEGGGYGHNTDPFCQSPFFSIDRVPPARPSSILRLADATAALTLEVDRLFVNPAMTLATPLVRGQLGRIDVTDDRQITEVEAMWWVEGRDEQGTFQTGYDVMAAVASNGISFRMPSETSGPGWLEVRVGLAAPELTCNAFSECSVTINGSEKFDATLQ